MRILFVNKFLFLNGGSESYIFQLGKCLEGMGHEIQYFGMDHKDRCVGNRAGAYTKNLNFHKGSFKDKFMAGTRIIYSREARKKIRAVLDDFHPDVCHLNNFNYQLTPSIILEIVRWRNDTGRSCRIVYTAHDYQLLCPNHMFRNPNDGSLCMKCSGGSFYHCMMGRCIHGSRMRSILGTMEGYFWKWKKVYGYIDTVICCSRFMKKQIDGRSDLSDKTIMLRNFIEGHYKTQKRVKKPYIIYFGRYSEEKGIRDLAQVCRELQDIDFVFAGDGPLKELLRSANNIHDVGFKSKEELMKLVSEARFSIYPSIWYENGPFSIMESISVGTPVLGADIGGIPELIRPGVCGELFKSGDKDELRKKITSLWEDGGRLAGYADNCFKTHFDDVEEYCVKLINIYQQSK